MTAGLQSILFARISTVHSGYLVTATSALSKYESRYGNRPIKTAQNIQLRFSNRKIQAKFSSTRSSNGPIKTAQNIHLSFRIFSNRKKNKQKHIAV